MKFRIWTILWVFALLASALATFGGGGLWIAVVVLAFWTLVFNYRKIPFWEWVTISCILIVLVMLLLPAVQSAREVARRNSCMNNMMQLSLSLLNYENRNGTLPPPYMTDASGTKLWSWRALVLSDLENWTLQERLKFNEPWNSTVNQAILDSSGWLEVYQCPAYATAKTTTNYLAVVDQRAAWHPERGRKVSEFKDGTANTVILIESPGQNVPWASPTDLSFDEAITLLTSTPKVAFSHMRSQGYFYKPTPSINVGFVDGSVITLELPISEEHAVALLTIDGGEEIDAQHIPNQAIPQLDYARIYSLCIFVVVALLPALVGKKPEGETTVLDLKGLGKDLWQGVDPDEYVAKERDSWD